ncbi:MAG: type I methionyl aminopeptidase [Rickettsiales bacterium]|nr:type I methionyl aminopeptidase [Rickettsiales bacterium]OUV81685.1 MAG: type I methionyl aminopeptidase [Rickettsiales bacterium TMED131]
MDKSVVFDNYNNPVTIHTEQDFENMRSAGKLASKVLDFITPHVKPNITTEKLDKLCHDYIISKEAIPAPLNYKGFPKSICTSVNHVVCHGIPSEKTLKDGDVLNIDITVILNGWHGDTSRMFFIGKKSIKSQRLIETTFNSMWEGIKKVKPGNTLGDIGNAIQKYAESRGYSIVRDFCGHGIGKIFHSAPNVLHYGNVGEGMKLEKGMFFTIEPMINIGKKDIKILDDGWTAVTRDKKLSAQYEHTIGVTENGFEVFTLSNEEKAHK